MDLWKIFGAADAQKKLEQHRLRLYRIAYSWTHNRALADDLTQETLIKAMRKASQLRDPDAGNAWLYSILANCYRDHLRRSREMDDIDESDIEGSSNPEQESSELEIVHQVRGAMSRLSDGQRQVISLVDIEGFSYVEVAQILNVPIGTVMSRLCRARAALRDELLNWKQPASSQGATIRRIK